MRPKKVDTLLEKAIEIGLFQIGDVLDMGADLGPDATEKEIVDAVLEAAQFFRHFDNGKAIRALLELCEINGLTR